MNALPKLDLLTKESLYSLYNKDSMIAKMNIIDKTNFKVRTYHYSPASLCAMDVSKEKDVYMSINPMRFKNRSIRRCKDNVDRLMFCFADIDCYTKELSKEQVLMHLYEEYFNCSIPFPTFIVDSGRGLYLFWQVDEHINAYNRWLKVQQYLHSHLAQFGSDDKVVSDSARVFRMVGSVNSKNNSTVSIIDGNLQKYSLYEIMQEYMPDSYLKKIGTSVKNKKNEGTPKTSSKNSKKEKSNIIPFRNNNLLSARIFDLEVLLTKHRDYEGSGRESILFLYRYFLLCQSLDKEYSLEETLSLNNKLKHSLSEKEVAEATKSAERAFDDGMKYRFSNKKLVSFLGLTEEEIKDMKSIISPAEKEKRRATRNREAYLRRLEEAGKDTKEVSILSRRKAVYKALKEGKTQAEICAQLNMSRSTFYEDKKAILALSEKELLELEGKIVSAEPFLFVQDSPENSSLVLREGYVVPVSRTGTEDKEDTKPMVIYEVMSLDDRSSLMNPSSTTLSHCVGTQNMEKMGMSDAPLDCPTTTTFSKAEPRFTHVVDMTAGMHVRRGSLSRLKESHDTAVSADSDADDVVNDGKDPP